MRAAVEAGPRVRTAVLTKLYPTRSHTGAAQGGMCAALANVEEDNWEWHTFDTVKGGDYLADQDAVEIMCKEAIDAVLDLEKMGMPFNRTPEGRIDQRRFGGHTRDHGKAPVRRACYAADRTGHMILQTLYQNCVKHDVEFFNEFYALDLALTETAGGPGGAPASSPTSWPPATSTSSTPRPIVFATGGVGPDVQDHLQRAHPDRRRHGHRVPQGTSVGGHGVSPVPSDRPGRPGHPDLRGGARRGRPILLNGEGERFMERYAPTIVDLAPARHRRPLDGARGAGGPRRRPAQGLRLHRRAPPRRGRARGQAARHHRVRPHLPGRRPGARSWCRCTRPATT